VDEQRAALTGAGSWDGATGRTDIPAASVTTSGVSVQLENVSCITGAAAPVLNGTGRFQGDLVQLQRWFATSPASPSWKVRGQLSGQAVVSHSAGVSS